MSEGTGATEGSVEIPVQKNVFYNPPQVINRDLSVVALKAFHALRTKQCSKASRRAGLSEGPLRVLEPLAASGLRSLRYCLELEEDVMSHVTANDIDPSAAEEMRRNRESNGVTSDRMSVVCSEATDLMNRPASAENGAFDVIDLDPYGSVAPFLDAAVRAVVNGGLLCLTSTDMPVLCGNHPEVAFYKYGGTALKAPYMHEMALRLVLNAVNFAAARYKRVVIPLMSCSIDFYVRVFVQIWDSAGGCKALGANTSLVLQCAQCDAFVAMAMNAMHQRKRGKQKKVADDEERHMTILEELEVVKNQDVKRKATHLPIGGTCEECGGGISVGGPFYSGSLHHWEFLEELESALSVHDHQSSRMRLSMEKKLAALITTVEEEMHCEAPLFYSVSQMTRTLKLETMSPAILRETLEALGHRASYFHRDPLSVKTDAPPKVVYDVLREWAKRHPPKTRHPALERPVVTEDVVFGTGKKPSSGGKRKARWLPNPEPYWGPKARAKKARTEEEENADPSGGAACSV